MSALYTTKNQVSSYALKANKKSRGYRRLKLIEPFCVKVDTRINYANVLAFKRLIFVIEIKAS